MTLAATINAFFNSNVKTFKRVAISGARLFADGRDYLLEDDCIFENDFDLVATRQDFADHAARIDHLNQGVGAHRNVINDTEWRTFYDVAQRNFVCVTTGHPAGTLVPMDSAPCSGCGLCLPLEQLQIDHLHPQDGGALPPILKVFRSLGLTVSGPKGPLGTAVRTNHLAGGNNATGGPGNPKLAKGRLAVLVRGPKYVGPHAPFAKQGRLNRHTTSEAGNAFLSVFWHLQAMPALENACRNSLVNLRPLCGVCNRTKWNTPRVYS